jgi:hypothetical protein
VFVELTAEIREAVIVGGFENDFPGDLQCVQDWKRLRRGLVARKAATQGVRQRFRDNDVQE